MSELDRRRLELVRAGAQPSNARLPRSPSGHAQQQRTHQNEPRASRPPPAPGREAAPTARVTSRADAAATSEAPQRAEAADAAARTAESAEAVEEAARARREDRRRARAERLAQDLDRPAAPIPSAQLPEDSSIPRDDGRVVTIRASRAGGGDVIVPGGPRPLRPAQPAVQPKRRRFTRNR